LKNNKTPLVDRVKDRFKRAVMKIANSLPVIALLYVISLAVGALSFFILEDAPLGDGLWWSIVSALTVGYGDEAPVTTAGRIVAGFLLIFWILFLTPCLIANFVVRILHDKNEYTHAEQEWLQLFVIQASQKLGIDMPPPPRDTDHMIDEE
jgi:lysylphosphatidylglycerol synthetase-like protein (DUF2156 family)